MITPKTIVELEIMREGGRKLAEILTALIGSVKVGGAPLDIDTLAQQLIKEAGCSPSFMTVNDYKWATCISVNDGVVHGIPSKTPFKAGDLVSVDVGLIYRGYHSDTSWSTYLPEGNSRDASVKKFLQVGEQTLYAAIAQAKSDNHIGHISQAIQQGVEGAGYSVVRGLVGHGIGKKLHEAPQVPGILNRPIEQTPKLIENMTLAIEVIYSMGSPEIVHSNDDGWTLATADGSLAGLFEQTVIVSKTGGIVLTRSQK